MKITVLPIAFDENSSYQRGSARGPAEIHKALLCDSSNMWTEAGLDLGTHPGWEYSSESPFSGNEKMFSGIEQTVSDLLTEGSRLIALGGDHSITYPVFSAHAKYHGPLDILHFDAHPDLYDQLDGNRLSHACPFARIMEDYPDTRLVQIGIRTATGHQREQATRFGVEMIEMKDIGKISPPHFFRPVYLSIDLDCLDPAFAPGVSHHEPGGLSTRELLGLLARFKGRIIGADIVEYNPQRDLGGVTAMVAAKLLKEILGRMLTQSPSS